MSAYFFVYKDYMYGNKTKSHIENHLKDVAHVADGLP